MATKLCSTCSTNSSSRSGIIKGKYYSDLCDYCYLQLTIDQSPSSGHADYNRQRDLEDHLGDIAQPYVGGQPNPDFIKLYPEKAQAMFSKDELRRHG